MSIAYIDCEYRPPNDQTEWAWNFWIDGWMVQELYIAVIDLTHKAGITVMRLGALVVLGDMNG